MTDIIQHCTGEYFYGDNIFSIKIGCAFANKCKLHKNVSGDTIAEDITEVSARDCINNTYQYFKKDEQ